MYNIIGDLHGKDPEKYFDKECINIFLGDYFDPYESISLNEMQDNFLKLMELKKEYPDTILLYGNHDFHYLVEGEKYSRYNKWQASRIKELFDEFEDYFYGVCYSINEEYICSHAGITKAWLLNKEIDTFETLKELENNINNLWSRKEERLFNFGFATNTNDAFDFYGTTLTHSPIWIRAHTLFDCGPIKKDVKQIVGHTQFEKIVNTKNVIFIDVLNYSGETLKINLEDKK
jgi:hypothetical protein